MVSVSSQLYNVDGFVPAVSSENFVADLENASKFPLFSAQAQANWT